MRGPGRRHRPPLRGIVLGVLLLLSCESVTTTVSAVFQVQVDPPSASMGVGETLQLTAVLLDAQGRRLSGRTVSWESTGSAVVEVTGQGMVTALGPGRAAIIASAEGHIGSAPITVTVGASIALEATDVRLDAVSGGPAPPTKIVSISNGGDGILDGLTATVSYAAGQPTGWLSAVLTGPTAPTTLRIAADLGGLGPGIYDGTVTVRAGSSSTGAAIIRVVLHLTERLPEISLSPATVGFSAIAGEADPPPQQVSITNAGPGALDGLSVTTVYGPGQPTGWLGTVLGSTVAPTSLTVRPSTAGLSDGAYTASVRVSSPVAGNSPRDVAVTFTVGAPPPTDLEVRKTGPGAVDAGSTFTYTIVLKNLGPTLAIGAVLSDTLPSPATFVSASDGGSLSGGVVTWPAIASMSVGDSVVRTVTVRAPASGQLLNIAAARALTADPVPGNNDGSASGSRVLTTVSELADLVVLKSGPTSVDALAQVTYVIRVRNAGPSSAANVVVSDLLPTNAKFVSASDGGTESAGVVSWPPRAVLAAGDSIVRTVVVEAPTSGALLNVASALAATRDPNPANNDGSAAASRVTTTVVGRADVSVTKTGPARANGGGVVAYTLTIANAGPSTATAVVVRDVLPTGSSLVSASSGGTVAGGVVTWPAFDLAPGSQVTRTLSVQAPASGTMVNVASSSATTVDPQPGNNDGSAPESRVTTTLNGQPTASITAPPNNSVFPAGAAVTFTGSGNDAEDGALTGSSLVWSSSLAGSIGTGASFTTSALAAGTHQITLSATDSEGAVGTAQITVRINGLPTATITAPADGSVFTEGQAVTFTGIGSDPGGAPPTLTWSSSLDGALGSGSSLTISTLSRGKHTVTLTATDSDGGTDTDQISIVVHALPTAAITTPADGSIFLKGQPVTFTGSGSDPDGTAVTLAWSSNIDGALGTGSPLVVTTLSAGLHTITLTVTDGDGGIATAQVSVNVNSAPVATITSPADGSLFPRGTPVTFTGTGTDPDGTVPTLTWSSDVDGNLGSGSPLTVTSLSGGPHVITLTATDALGATGKATISIQVNTPPTATVTAPADGSVFTLGQAVTFTGTGIDPDGAAPTLTWSSSIDGNLGGGSPLTVSTLTAGTHVITLTATDADGATGTAQVTIRINTPPVAAITSPANGSLFPGGSAVTFTGTGTDADGQAVTLSWTSSVDGNLGTGSPLTVSSLSSGTHVITLTATDPDGASGTAAVTIQMNSPPTATIIAPADGSVYRQGQTVKLDGSGADPDGGTPTLTWTSSIAGDLGTGPTLSVTTLAIGTHVITLTATDAEGATGTAQISIRINDPPVATITSPANNSIHTAGTPITFTGTGTDSDSRAPRLVWSSDRDGSLGSGSSITVTLSAGTHLITLTAHDQDTGEVDIDQITVIVQ